MAKSKFSEMPGVDAWIHNETGFLFSMEFVHFSVPIEYCIVTPEIKWIFGVYDSFKVTDFSFELPNSERQHKGSELRLEYERALPLLKEFLYFQNEIISNESQIEKSFKIIIELPPDKFFSRIDEILDNVEKFHHSFSDRIKASQLNDKKPSDTNKTLLRLSEQRHFLVMRMLEGVMESEEKQSNFMEYLVGAFSTETHNSDALKVTPLPAFMSKMKVYISRHLT